MSMLQYGSNPTMNMLGLPNQLQQYQMQQYQDAQQPQNPGIQMGGAAQPIPPVGSAMGPSSVGPVMGPQSTPGVPQVPASMAANVPTPPPRPASFGNAGQGFNNFTQNAGQQAQPLGTQAPQQAAQPQSTNGLISRLNGQGNNQHQGLINKMLTDFGVKGGLAGLFGGGSGSSPSSSASPDYWRQMFGFDQPAAAAAPTSDGLPTDTLGDSGALGGSFNGS